MQPVEGCDRDATEAASFHQATGTIGRTPFRPGITHAVLEPGNIFLYQDLRIEHVRLAKLMIPPDLSRP